jgi:hypothetical protein
MFEVKAVERRKIIFRKVFKDEQEAAKVQRELEEKYWTRFGMVISFNDLTYFGK